MVTRGGMSETVALPWSSGDVSVRAARPDDDLDAVHRGDPLWIGSARVEQWLASLSPQVVGLSLVAERDATLVGHALLSARPTTFAGMGSGYAFAPLEGDHRDAFRALSTVMAHQCHLSGLPGYVGWVDAADVATRAAISELGGRELEDHVESELDLARIDRNALRQIVERAEAEGIRLAPLSTIATEEQWASAYEVYVAVLRAAPDSDRGVDVPDLDTWRARIPDPTMVELAWEDGEAVGMSCVSSRPDLDVVNAGLVGVVRKAWGRSIPTALKASQALRLADRGMRRVVTQDLEIRDPVAEADETLGFTPVRTWIQVELPAVAPS